MKKAQAKIIVIIMAIIVLISGCNASDNFTEDNPNSNIDINNDELDKGPEFGGELNVPITYYDTINPLITKSRSVYYFDKLLYESLFELDNNFDVKMVLAKGYDIEDEGHKIKITLRDDVYWHDGEKFTSKDVKFTIDTIKYASLESKYKNMIYSIFKTSKPSDLQHILNVNIIDEYNLEIISDRSNSNIIESLTFPILPRHEFVEEDGNEKDYYDKALDSKNFIPIGTGPYELVKINNLKNIMLKVNENWWKGKPYIEKITGILIDDELLANTSFESGLIDLTSTVGVDWEKYMENKNVKIYEFVSQDYEFIGFNFKKDIFKGSKGKELRKAIAYGINRKSIIENVYLGHATQIDVPISPNSWLISEKSNYYGYNADKAKELLEGAGWKDIDDDGILEDENGNDLVLNLTTNSFNQLRAMTADAIVDDLKKIGIKVIKDYAANDNAEISEEIKEEQWDDLTRKINTGDFDMVLLGWQLSPVTDLSFAFHSSQIPYGTNFISYVNEDMDRLILEAFESNNREEKLKKYKEIQDLIVEELPYFSLFFKNNSILVNNRVKGEIDPNIINIYNNIENYYIPKAYQKNEVE